MTREILLLGGRGMQNCLILKRSPHRNCAAPVVHDTREVRLCLCQVAPNPKEKTPECLMALTSGYGVGADLASRCFWWKLSTLE